MKADPAVFDSWSGLWEGLASMEDFHLLVQERLDYGDPSFTWRLVPHRRSSEQICRVPADWFTSSAGSERGAGGLARWRCERGHSGRGV